MRTLAAITLIALCAPDAYAGCRHLYYKQAAVVAVPVQAVYYDVGAGIREKAIAIKAVEEATPRIVAEVTRQFQALQAGTPQGGLALKTAPTLLAQKCGRCHNPQSQETDFFVDGSPITFGHYKRFDEIFGLKQNIPEKMKALVASITPEEIGQLKQEMIGLPIEGTAAQPAPLEAPPEPAPPAEAAPPPPPAGPPLQPGDRRWSERARGWVEYGDDGHWHPVPAPAPPAEPANGLPDEPPAKPDDGRGLE